MTAASRLSSKQHLKKVDYSDISMSMVHQQRAQAVRNNRGQSLRASRFAEPDPMLTSLPQNQNANSNAQ